MISSAIRVSLKGALMLLLLPFATPWLPEWIDVGTTRIPITATIQGVDLATGPFRAWVGGTLMPLFFAPVEIALAYAGIPWSLDDVIGSVPQGRPGLREAARLAFAAMTVAIAYMFWATAISRTVRAVGVYNPFGNARRPRRWLLRALVRVREGLDAASFGQGASANWAGIMEVIANEYRRGDLFLGRPRLPLFGAMLRPVGIEPKKHMVTIAGTGSGKSSGALIPNLLVYPGAVLVIDPKGELARVTARPRFERLGQDVIVLDPYNTVGEGWESGCYNVFDELAAVAAERPEAAVSMADRIAQALVKPMSEKDSYWDIAPQTFLKGLILFVFVCEPPERRNLVRMRQLLALGDVEAHRQAVEAGTFNANEFTPLDMLLWRMREAEDGPYGEIISAAAKVIEYMGPNQKSGVLTSADEHTSFLDFPEIRRISTHSDFLLRDLKRRKLSIYACLPVTAATGKAGRWLRMYAMLFTHVMQDTPAVPKPPILLAIDEFPSLGRIQGIEHVAPLLRSFGVRFWAIGQDIEQFRTTYPDSWGGFIGGASAVQFMGVTHPETLNYIVDRLGRHQIGKGGVQQEKPLLDADQVARLLAVDNGNQIIWRGEHRAMLLKIAPYHRYLPAWQYDRDSRFKETWRARFWRWAMRQGS